MSGRMMDAREQEALAAEYALGTLDHAERREAEALMSADPGFVDLVRRWEKRLGELVALVEPVEPAPEIWHRIAARIPPPSGDMRLPEISQAQASPVEGAEIVPMSRRLRRWRSAAMAAAALAATLLIFIAVSQFSRPTKPSGWLIAVLQHDPKSPGFVLAVEVATKTFVLRNVAAETLPGRSYELWLISDKLVSPASLGVVEGDFMVRPALAQYD
ncbi:MAG: anti-sigma factor, partial [Pseudomonadota bacterium]|nr:anti-sigma factor [Pseudomonadota bacterium]